MTEKISTLTLIVKLITRCSDLNSVTNESESRPAVAGRYGSYPKPKIETFIKVDPLLHKKESLYERISSNICFDVAVKNLFVLIVSTKKII